MSPGWCLVLMAVAAALACAIMAEEAARSATHPAPPAARPASGCIKGRVVVLPGVYNTRFQLRRFVAALERQQPGFDVEVRPWGVPLRPLHNIGAYGRNVATAKRLADELAQWRLHHADELLYLVGYSGGGGLAVLTVAELPEQAHVDRLVLIAPAVSPDYPLERRVLPRVRELAVNYASAKDLQVGWGTTVFGTIDRKRAASAGAAGFRLSHPKVLQWRWTAAARRLGHRGNHVAFLGARWQRAALLPALDPAVDASSLARAWAAADSYGALAEQERWR